MVAFQAQRSIVEGRLFWQCRMTVREESKVPKRVPAGDPVTSPSLEILRITIQLILSDINTIVCQRRVYHAFAITKGDANESAALVGQWAVQNRAV